jgi:alpha-D-ribose 1-methylphosphonate 5-triphosphate synthase subunit PhnH
MKNDMAIVDSNIWDPAKQQKLFRSLLDAFSYPGRITQCATASTSSWFALLSTLVDGQTTLADPHKLIEESQWPKLEAHRASPEVAAFVVVDGSRTPEFMPSLGTLEAPEYGATLMLRVTSLNDAGIGTIRLQLSGPGIQKPMIIGVEELHADWITSRNDWVSTFPLGVELVLCDANSFVALPRTTLITVGGAA